MSDARVLTEKNDVRLLFITHRLINIKKKKKKKKRKSQALQDGTSLQKHKSVR